MLNNKSSLAIALVQKTPEPPPREDGLISNPSFHTLCWCVFNHATNSSYRSGGVFFEGTNKGDESVNLSSFNSDDDSSPDDEGIVADKVVL